MYTTHILNFTQSILYNVKFTLQTLSLMHGTILHIVCIDGKGKIRYRYENVVGFGIRNYSVVRKNSGKLEKQADNVFVLSSNIFC